MFDLSIVNLTSEGIEAYEPIIERILEEVIKTESIDDFIEVSVVFVTKEEIKRLNHEYRSIDQVTDVISFALRDEDTLESDVYIPTLGDVFICLDVAKEQAESYQHSLEREVGFLACHGFLHLLGYDHEGDEDAEAMFSKQEAILSEVGLKRGE